MLKYGSGIQEERKMGGSQFARNKTSWVGIIETLEARVFLSTAAPIRIDAGGPGYTDTAGNYWTADQYYSGGAITNMPYTVNATNDDALYYSRRWGNFSYNIPVPSRPCTLNLFFSESRDDGANERLFNVSAEGSPILTRFDAFATAGYQTAMTESFDVTVVNGVLNLNFASVKDVAMISAIEVIPTAAVTNSPPPGPWSDTDIGSPARSGSFNADSNDDYIVSGGGADIWNSVDAFNYAYQPLVGDGTIIARVTSQQNTSPWAKSGIMIRESLNPDSRFAMLVLTPGNGVSFQSRAVTHNNATFSTTAGSIGVWLELVRTGSTISGYISNNGTNWTAYGSVSIPMVNNVFVGMCVTAHNNSALSTATFADVSVNADGANSSIWSDGATSPMFRWEAQSFTYNNQLYIFGGFNDEQLGETDEADAYNPATDSWQVVTHIPVGGLSHAGTAVVGDTAYFAGGDIGQFMYGSPETATSEVLTYNLATNTWGSITPLPQPVAAGGLVSINNVLYFYGGLNASDTADVSNTWAFDLSNPAAGWVAKSPMPDARNHIGYVAINGLAYAVGGQHLYNEYGGNDSEVDAYNPITNQWTTVASLPMTWSSVHTTTMAVNGKIVILGGQTNGGYDGIYLNNIEEYDPVANQWSAIGTLPEANEGESDAYINGELIVVGGTVDDFGGIMQDQTWITAQIGL
jgi:N-acetylneuraminic acid mutarotase/regulation of enolase protein 1 (concanavalin A-like superfamily)